jgi:hypothetical protein
MLKTNLVKSDKSENESEYDDESDTWPEMRDLRLSCSAVFFIMI